MARPHPSTARPSTARPRRPHISRALFGALLISLTVNCGAGNGPEVSVNGRRPLDVGSLIEPVTGLDWSEVSDELDEATLEVPLDYANPERGTVSLYIERHRATKPSKWIGSLLVNPGGPGFGGSYLAEQASLVFGAEIVERFDIIGWDPRGTGKSEPAVDCVDVYDPYFGVDSSPADQAALDELARLAKDFADHCHAAHPDLLPYISTVDSARDMDSIRAALGEDKISYFGFSYGSELGSTWVTMFPGTVRAAVFDGAVDPNQGAIDATLAQAIGFEQALDSFLASCSLDADCAFHNGGDAEGAFDALIASIDATPLVVSADRTPVYSGVALTAVARAMYDEGFWPALEQALADAQDGNGAPLLGLHDAYFQRLADGTYGNELEAFSAIECLDDAGPKTVAEIEAYRAQFVAAAPRFGDQFISGYTCVFWPVPSVPDLPITGVGAGPIVVIGTTGDPATPLSSTEAMAAALDQGHLIVVEADKHTGYNSNSCINDAVARYLIDLVPPTPGLRC